MMTEHTKNWVIFEDGVAAATGKQLFLFERKGIPLKYPVPYLTDYMIFDEKNIMDLLKIQTISKQFKKYFSVKESEALIPPSPIPFDSFGAIVWSIYTIFKILRKERITKKLGLFKIKCPRCESSFYYHSPQHTSFRCPSCRGKKLYVDKHKVE